MKNLVLILLGLFIIHCSTSTNISTVPIPPASSTPDSLVMDSLRLLDYANMDSLTTVDSAFVDEEDTVSVSDTISQEPKLNLPEQPTIPTVTEEKTDKVETVKPKVPATPVKPPKKEPNTPSKKKIVETKSFDYRNFNRDAYRTGEKLTFDINYLAITAGEAIMSVPQEYVYNGRLVQKIVFQARSSRSYSWIYKVEDNYVSLMDKYGIYPWKFNKEINEGSFHTKEEVVFDHIKEVAIEDGKEINIPPYTHDIISAFYYVRNQDLTSMKPGEIFKLSNYSSGKIHPLDVRFVGWEKLTVPAGTFNCIVIEPLVRAGGLFKDEGTLFVWLTNDQLKIPVKVATKVVIGSINVELTKIEGVNRPIPAKIK